MMESFKNKTKYSHEYDIPKTISQSIYNYLKKSIIENEIKANQKINEKEIADIFKVSRTPVREAVVRLAAEGFVKISSHRESVVREVSFEEIEQIFQVVGALDSLAAGLVVDKLRPKEVAELEKMTMKMEDHYKQKDVEKYINMNYSIHDRIWNNLANTNDFLLQILKNCSFQLRRCNYYALNRAFENPEVIERSMNSHREILKWVKVKNKEKLRTVLREHWIPPFP